MILGGEGVTEKGARAVDREPVARGRIPPFDTLA